MQAVQHVGTFTSTRIALRRIAPPGITREDRIAPHRIAQAPYRAGLYLRTNPGRASITGNRVHGSYKCEVARMSRGGWDSAPPWRSLLTVTFSVAAPGWSVTPAGAVCVGSWRGGGEGSIQEGTCHTYPCRAPQWPLSVSPNVSPNDKRHQVSKR